MMKVTNDYAIRLFTAQYYGSSSLPQRRHANRQTSSPRLSECLHVFQLVAHLLPPSPRHYRFHFIMRPTYGRMLFCYSRRHTPNTPLRVTIVSARLSRHRRRPAVRMTSAYRCRAATWPRLSRRVVIGVRRAVTTASRRRYVSPKHLRLAEGNTHAQFRCYNGVIIECHSIILHALLPAFVTVDLLANTYGRLPMSH